MTDDPIKLDGHRTAAGQRDAEMRRRPSESQLPSAPAQDLNLETIENLMLAEPARSWVQVMEKWRFLLERYAATPEAADERIRKLISRALGDMERLRKFGERK